MTPGGVIAIATATGFVSLVLYGLGCDVARRMDEASWVRFERRGADLLRMGDIIDQPLFVGLGDWELGEVALVVAEIRALPSVEPWRRWTR